MSKAISLAWRPPLDVAALLDFFARRQIGGIELVDGGPALNLRRTLQLQAHGKSWRGWLSISMDATAHRAQLHVSESLMGVLPTVIWRVRALLDLDADPSAINAALHAHFPDGDGLRVPGSIDGFELAVRAILGQQITVAAARTLAQRLVERLGETIATPWPELNRLFPTPDIIALTPPKVLGEMGIVRQRQVALQALALAVHQGCLDLSPHAEPQTAITALQAIPGIGPWTAQYIAMRALRWPDAWLVGDVALTKALGLPDHRGREAQREAEQRSQSWRPWRSYAVIRAWAQRSPSPSSPSSPKQPTENHA